MNAMMKRVNCVPKPVMQGGKVLYFTVPKDKVFARTSGLCFVDSLNFLKMPLSAFTKTFGLKTKKGFYPHFFNTAANANTALHLRILLHGFSQHGATTIA